mgnify:CR=1 FL=1
MRYVEVDEFVDEVEESFAQLIEENQNLKKQVEALKAAPPPQPVAPAAPTVQAPPPRQPAPPAATVRHDCGDHGQGGERRGRAPRRDVDRAGRSAWSRKPPRTPTGSGRRANRTAHQLTTDARTRAERVESEARVNAERLQADAHSRAEKLDREIESRRGEMFGDLERQRDDLTAAVASLRNFRDGLPHQSHQPPAQADRVA